MERILLYLDDIDDLVGAIGLLFEPFRRLFLAAVATGVVLASVASAVLLALANPPAALAISLLLALTLVYRAVTYPPQETRQAV